MKEGQELSDKQLRQLLELTKLIQKKAKEAGVEMSKAQAKRAAIDRFGYVDKKFRDEVNRENIFRDYAKTANPKYRKSL